MQCGNGNVFSNMVTRNPAGWLEMVVVCCQKLVNVFWWMMELVEWIVLVPTWILRTGSWTSNLAIQRSHEGYMTLALAN